MQTMTTQIDFKQVNNDINGNQRLVCHFFNLLTESEISSYSMDNSSQLYALAIRRSKRLNGRKFHNKQYGGGIVFSTGNSRWLSDKINDIKQSAENTEEIGRLAAH